MVRLEDATRVQIDNAFDELQDKVAKAVAESKQTVVVLFVAGHGVNVDGKNYLLGIEAEGSNNTRPRGVESNGVKPEQMLGELYAYLGRDGSQQNFCVCILDCCRQIPEFQKDSLQGTLTQGGLLSMQNWGGTIVLYACDEARQLRTDMGAT